MLACKYSSPSQHDYAPMATASNSCSFLSIGALLDWLGTGPALAENVPVLWHQPYCEHASNYQFDCLAIVALTKSQFKHCNALK